MTSSTGIPIVRLRLPSGEVCYRIKNLRAAILRHFEDFGVDFLPDFQRGHVWTPEQRTGFIEGIITGAVDSKSIKLRFNSAHESDIENYSGDLPREAQTVDGLQRFTALDLFVSGEVKAFGRSYAEFKGTEFDISELPVSVQTYAFAKKTDLLDFYLAMNTGGTPHSAEEIARVRAMRTSL